MNKSLFWRYIASLLFAIFLPAAAGAQDGSTLSVDPSGVLQTINANGSNNSQGAFFQSLGTNGRSCSTCHVTDQAMSISPPQIRRRFDAAPGRAPPLSPC